MLRLLLLRHAKAVGPSANDFARALAPQGRDEAVAMADYLKTELLLPDFVLASDAARTRETAELAVSKLDPTPIQYDHAIYTGNADVVMDVLRQTAPSVKTLLVVGHNPTLHDLALALVGYGDRYAAQRMNSDFPTCCLAVLDFDIESWAQVASRSGRLDRFVILKPN